MPKLELELSASQLSRVAELLEAFDKEKEAAKRASSRAIAGRRADRAAATSDAEADAAERQTGMNPKLGALGKRLSMTGSASTSLPPLPTIAAPPPPDVAVFVSDAGTIFDQDDVIQATLQLASEVSVAAATDLLKEFGVERAREIAGADWEKYVTKAKALVTAHKAAMSGSTTNNPGVMAGVTAS